MSRRYEVSRVAMRLGIAVGSAAALVFGLVSVNGAQASPDVTDSPSESGNVSAQAKSNYQVCGYNVAASTTTQAGNSGNETTSLRSKKGKPSKVRKLKVPPKKVTTKKVKIRWNKPKRTGSTKLKKYQFRLKAKGSKWKKWKGKKPKWKGKKPKKLAINKKQKKKQKKFKKVYKKLQPGTSYIFQVRAKNKTGNGKGKKKGVKFQTLPDCAPNNNPVNPGQLNTVNYVYTNNNPDDWKNSGGTLRTVQTTQFVDSIPSVITVKTPSGDGCIAVFDQFDGKPFTAAGSSDPIQVKPPDGSDPQQLTIIPWVSSNGGCNINTDFVQYDPSIVIAVFVSKRYFSSPPSNATVCKISASDAAAIDQMALTSSGGNKWTKGDCVIDKPRVRKLNGKDKYTGSLFTMASDGKSKELYIELEAGVELKTPLNAMVASTDVGADPCVITTKRPITVTGFGRLDSNVKDFVNGTQNQTGKYKVDTGQLIINSSAAREFPIDVSGITVSNSPSRNDSAVKLNFEKSCKPNYGTPSKEDGYNSNRSAKVFDVKRVIWNGESDAYEVGAKSYVGNSWILNADDTIKISSTEQFFQDITVIQGAAGGVINIGSYGFNYGTAGSSVDGLYVPRILQKDRGFASAGSGALIQTLTCPVKNLANNDQSITDVNVNNFQLAGLGDINGSQVNTYPRAFSLGVSLNSGFCSQPDSPSTTIGNFKFTDMNLYQNPMTPGNTSWIYDESSSKKLPKANFLPIRFCETDNLNCNKNNLGPQDQNSPVATYPFGTKGPGGYYMCGTGAANQCWLTDGTTAGANPAAQQNIQYRGDNDWSNKVVFPYQ